MVIDDEQLDPVAPVAEDRTEDRVRAQTSIQLFRATDGDTVRVLNFGTASTVRLLGLDNDGHFGRKKGF